MFSGPLLNEQVEGQFMSLDINKIKEQIEQQQDADEHERDEADG